MSQATPAAEVVLVDAEDRVVGAAGKVEAHRSPGQLHRAVSAFVFDGADRLILQRRASVKYHFAGLWSNTCCTHPAVGETPAAAGERRLREELGFSCTLEPVGTFLYRAEDASSGLVEHELDHVVVGRFDGDVHPEPEEVDDVRRIAVADLLVEVAQRPDAFTPWLLPAVEVLGGHRSGPGVAGPASGPNDRRVDQSCGGTT